MTHSASTAPRQLACSHLLMHACGQQMRRLQAPTAHAAGPPHMSAHSAPSTPPPPFQLPSSTRHTCPLPPSIVAHAIIDEVGVHHTRDGLQPLLCLLDLQLCLLCIQIRNWQHRSQSIASVLAAAECLLVAGTALRLSIPSTLPCVTLHDTFLILHRPTTKSSVPTQEMSCECTCTSLCVHVDGESAYQHKISLQTALRMCFCAGTSARQGH